MTQTLSTFSPLERPARHPLAHEGPAVDFFAGALLGNGALGAVVTTRPDAIVIHFGHNDVWDIRVAEDHQDQIGTFREIFARVAAIPSEYERLDQDPWYREYVALMSENYNKPYPRPFPCGSLVLGFDPRRAALLGHELDVATGCCTVRMRCGHDLLAIRIFVDMRADRLWLRVEDEHGAAKASPFERVRLLPDPEGLHDDAVDAAPGMFTALASLEGTTIAGQASHAEQSTGYRMLGPRLTAPEQPPADRLSFRQQLPFAVPAAESGATHPRDRAFRLTIRVSGELHDRPRRNWYGQLESMGPLERAPEDNAPLLLCVQLEHGLGREIGYDAGDVPPLEDGFVAATEHSRAAWSEYWSRSGVALSDELFEATWYHNLYFLRCATWPGATCPGLFANWSYRGIGSAWHGDYHMNYNTQQPFWAAFSSNHVELHQPYVELVEHLLPLSRRWASEYYELPGAAFPHSAYPTEMNIMPYPVPTWGWEICETPWTVQSLWWHYRYTLNRDFLERRAWEPIKAAVEFLTAYMLRPEARGERWGDDRYHVFPTVPPELYGLTPGFRMSYDCLVDLTLTRFVLNAFVECCAILDRRDEERELLAAVADVLEHFPAYPTAEFVAGDGVRFGAGRRPRNGVQRAQSGDDGVSRRRTRPALAARRICRRGQLVPQHAHRGRQRAGVRKSAGSPPWPARS